MPHKGIDESMRGVWQEFSQTDIESLREEVNHARNMRTNDGLYRVALSYASSCAWFARRLATDEGNVDMDHSLWAHDYYFALHTIYRRELKRRGESALVAKLDEVLNERYPEIWSAK